MMIARFHYDREIYKRFLDNELPSHEEQNVTAHVEECDECQLTLEAISQNQVDWNAIPRLLKRDSAFPNNDSASKSLPAFLTKSDQPNSLGRFGRFEIVECLGTGGMGVVLKGYDPALNRFSAIKVLAPVLATSASARKRFAREAKSAAAVVHEHVIPIQTVDEEDGLPYLVMPVVEGQSLQQRVDSTGPLETKEILRIGMQIASGLAAAHSQGLVHRDVKPANVLLENGVERILLTDFGLARAAEDANMTQSGVITGTPQYMSPEQAQGLNIDQRSDLFSLGSVLYFMCTGHAPFRAKTTFGVLNRIVSDEHRPVRHANVDIPEWLQDIIDRLLAKDKTQRYGTAAEVGEVLSQWLAYLQRPDLADKPPAIRTTAKSSGRRRGIRGGLLAVGGFLVLLAGFFISIELSKGTLTIECPDDGVPIRIMKGDRIEQQMTINRGSTTTRIAAGSYVVEIDGQTDALEIKQGAITLSHRGAAVAKIIEKSTIGKDTANDKSDAEQVRVSLEPAQVMRALARLDADTAEKLEPGQLVDVQIDAYPNQIFTGTIMEILKKHDSEGNAVARILIDNAVGNTLRAGMTAMVTIRQDERNGQQAAGQTRVEFVEGTGVMVVRGKKRNVERFNELVDRSGASQAFSSPQTARTPQTTSNRGSNEARVAFVDGSGSIVVVRGEQNAVDRVKGLIDRPGTSQADSNNDETRGREARIEFVEGANVVVVRGTREDVDRVKGLIDRSPADSKNDDNRPDKTRVKRPDETSVEFVEGTDVVVVRGRKENVARINSLIDQASMPQKDSNKKAGVASVEFLQGKGGRGGKGRRQTKP